MLHLPPSWVSSLQRERTTNEAEEQSIKHLGRVETMGSLWPPRGEAPSVLCAGAGSPPTPTPGSAGSHIQLQRASPGPWLSVPSLKRRDVM